MIRPVKHWWARMAAALLAAFSVLGFVIAQTPGFASQPAVVSEDALLTAESAFGPAQIETLLAAMGSPLAGYRETVGEQSLSIGELFWVAAQHSDYGLSPRALLATLSVENGLRWNKAGGLYAHLRQMALALQRGYQAGLAAQPAPAARGFALPQDTPATYAVAHYYSASAKTASQVRGSLQDWAAAYQQLFGQNPSQPAQAKAAATQVPFLRLPFDQPKDGFVPVEAFFDHATPKQYDEATLLRFDGKLLPGAHYSACWRGVTCYSGHNATDYTLPLGTPIYAAAAGTVDYRLDAEGGLVIDHANGYRTIYWHLDRILVNWNQPVSDGQLIGYSGTRGTSTHPHLHFGLRLTALSRDVDPYGWWSLSPDPWFGSSRYLWRGGLLADHGEATMQIFYEPYWSRDPQGHGGGSWYSHTTDQPGNSTNWAIWGGYIPAAGKYTVWASWPKNAANTSAAVYTVWHAGGATQVRANQQIDGSQFVALGSFQFNEGPTAVILTDLTPGAPKDQRVYFDAVRWEPTLPLRIYLPSVSSGK